MRTLDNNSVHQNLVMTFFQHFGHHFMYLPEEVEDASIYNDRGNFSYVQPEDIKDTLNEYGNIIAYRTIPENDECEEHNKAWGFLAFFKKNEGEDTSSIVVSPIEIHFDGMFGLSGYEMSIETGSPMEKAHCMHLLDTIEQGSFSTREYRVVGFSEEKWSLVDSVLEKESISLAELILRHVES